MYFAVFRRTSEQLSDSTLRDRIGNIYFKLDTRDKFKLFYGIMFFINRASLVLVVAIKFNFGI